VAERPLVSVVTPVFNTAAHLRECIDSVLAQTWPRLEYVVVDNHSTDGSRQIAEEAAARTGRVRVVRTPAHLPQLDNYNHALRQVARESAYVKLVAADDWLYPECVERMVAVAAAHPSVGLVGALALWGAQVKGAGLPYDAAVVPGRELARRQLLAREFYVGSPTTVLYRADLVRARAAFFDPRALHADTEVAYQLLREHDFGFVHQVLAYVREDPASISGRVSDLDPDDLDYLITLLRYGPDFLTPVELADRRHAHERLYCERYVRQVLSRRRARFLAYHRPALAALGYRFPRALVARVAAAEAAEIALNPKRTLGRLIGGWRYPD